MRWSSTKLELEHSIFDAEQIYKASESAAHLPKQQVACGLALSLYLVTDLRQARIGRRAGEVGPYWNT